MQLWSLFQLNLLTTTAVQELACFFKGRFIALASFFIRLTTDSQWSTQRAEACWQLVSILNTPWTSLHRRDCLWRQKVRINQFKFKGVKMMSTPKRCFFTCGDDTMSCQAGEPFNRGSERWGIRIHQDSEKGVGTKCSALPQRSKLDGLWRLKL